MPTVMLSALARRHDCLPRGKVASFPLLAIARHGFRLFARGTNYDRSIARVFAHCVKRLNTPHNVFFGYSYDSLELLEYEQNRGALKILCQTDPGPLHYKMLDKEGCEWPNYGSPKNCWWTEERDHCLRREWRLADIILVNSEWTRKAIISEGADASKIELLPLAFGPSQGSNAGPERSDQNKRRRRPVQILWLGNVAIGKGIQYLVEAARLLENEPVDFTVAGNIHISAAAVRQAPSNIRWLGRVPRGATSGLYCDCDVFVFPTLSDGFGLTQLEAMAQGKPVITTPNCGTVVEHGVSGIIVPPRDPRALADAILAFVRNRELAIKMRPHCLLRGDCFSIDAYMRRLSEIVHCYMVGQNHA